MLNRDVTYGEVKNAIRKGFEDSFGIIFRDKKLTKNQEKKIIGLSEKYRIVS